MKVIATPKTGNVIFAEQQVTGQRNVSNKGESSIGLEMGMDKECIVTKDPVRGAVQMKGILGGT